MEAFFVSTIATLKGPKHHWGSLRVVTWWSRCVYVSCKLVVPCISNCFSLIDSGVSNYILLEIDKPNDLQIEPRITTSRYFWIGCLKKRDTFLQGKMIVTVINVFENTFSNKVKPFPLLTSTFCKISKFGNVNDFQHIPIPHTATTISTWTHFETVLWLNTSLFILYYVLVKI